MTRELSAIQGFSGNGLDRAGNLRDEPLQIEAWRRAQDARTCLFAGDIPVLRREGNRLDPLFSFGEAEALGQLADAVLLGLDRGAPVFAARLVHDAVEPYQAIEPYAAIDLRTLAAQGALPPDELGILAQAKSLLFWHRRHGFCANCGARTDMAAAGWRRECAACGTHHFPRTDPVAIMMVVRGERCLLARQARFVPNVYSCLAGFVEPGETLEDAVRREVAEEAGIRVGAVRYLASQPWPFPSSLMIGCIGEAETDDIVLDRKELEEGRWFSRTEIRQMLAGVHPDGLLTPPPLAIAHHLLQAYAADGG